MPDGAIPTVRFYVNGEEFTVPDAAPCTFYVVDGKRRRFRCGFSWFRHLLQHLGACVGDRVVITRASDGPVDALLDLDITLGDRQDPREHPRHDRRSEHREHPRHDRETLLEEPDDDFYNLRLLSNVAATLPEPDPEPEPEPPVTAPDPTSPQATIEPPVTAPDPTEPPVTAPELTAPQATIEPTVTAPDPTEPQATIEPPVTAVLEEPDDDFYNLRLLSNVAATLPEPDPEPEPEPPVTAPDPTSPQATIEPPVTAPDPTEPPVTAPELTAPQATIEPTVTAPDPTEPQATIEPPVTAVLEEPDDDFYNLRLLSNVAATLPEPEPEPPLPEPEPTVTAPEPTAPQATICNDIYADIYKTVTVLFDPTIERYVPNLTEAMTFSVQTLASMVQGTLGEAEAREALGALRGWAAAAAETASRPPHEPEPTVTAPEPIDMAPPDHPAPAPPAPDTIDIAHAFGTAFRDCETWLNTVPSEIRSRFNMQRARTKYTT